MALGLLLYRDPYNSVLHGRFCRGSRFSSTKLLDDLGCATWKTPIFYNALQEVEVQCIKNSTKAYKICMLALWNSTKTWEKIVCLLWTCWCTRMGVQYKVLHWIDIKIKLWSCEDRLHGRQCLRSHSNLELQVSKYSLYSLTSTVRCNSALHDICQIESSLNLYGWISIYIQLNVRNALASTEGP
jgi:hypothetical protein